MLIRFISPVLLLISFSAVAQVSLDSLTVEKIMRDPKWVGISPTNPQWSADGKTLFFSWVPEKDVPDSLYFITPANHQPQKATTKQKQVMVALTNVIYNLDRSAYVYAKNGDIFYTKKKGEAPVQITNTTATERSPQFSFAEKKIVYTLENNLFTWDIQTGETTQLTNLVTGEAAGKAASEKTNQQEEWLKKDQLEFFQVLKERKTKKEQDSVYKKKLLPKEIREVKLSGKTLQGINISPDGRLVAYRLFKPSASKRTIVPSYVTESGFTTDIPGRTKVGAETGTTELFIFDRLKDTIYAIKADSIPGIKDMPAYFADYPAKLEALKKKNELREVNFMLPNWSPLGKNAVLEIRSQDNKDRWLMTWDTATQKLKLLDRQHDDAWIGGPGISIASSGWVSEDEFWFQSEKSGYSHLYMANTNTGNIRTLTSGNYETQKAQLSNDKKYFYITTNEVHPGEQHFYRLNIATGKKEKLTTMTGANQVALSPDETQLSILYSYSNKPWELYLQQNPFAEKKIKPIKAVQITDKAQSSEFRSYVWRDPEVMTFKATDGADVYARFYKPANPHPGKPAVIFVHGAGYLQNAHKWWSSYFREYMFHNMLADNGYYVMDIDYRGSAGYGRNWRTGIYRHMGGKDLSDHVDAANYLVKNFGVNPKHIGIYGGSYGGFITLMAMFTEPDVFASGAALRPVTDWAQYNHGYTANILNEPFADSIAYRRSSPLYFAERLKGNLLICHGMVDVNVHYQDAVKLTQRLIELGKDNWELASYPMEDHGFTEPSSWTDEYKRIYKLFERTLKNYHPSHSIF